MARAGALSERVSRSGLVLADASPLIALAIIDGFGWLHALLGSVTTTRTVLDEVAPDANRPGESAILRAVRKRRLRIVDDVHQEPAFDELDAGEASVPGVAVHAPRRCLIAALRRRSTGYVLHCPRWRI